MKIGAHHIDNRRREFIVWAPFLKSVELKIVSHREEVIPMEKDEKGYWRSIVEDISQGTRYFYRLEKERYRPDPASQFQPEGVHGFSQVIDHDSFQWEDADWKGITLSKLMKISEYLMV